MKTPWSRPTSPVTPRTTFPKPVVTPSIPIAPRMRKLDSEYSSGDNVSVTWATTLRKNFTSAVAAVASKIEGQRVPDEERGVGGRSPGSHDQASPAVKPAQPANIPVVRPSSGIKLYQSPEFDDIFESYSKDRDDVKVPVVPRAVYTTSICPSPITMTRQSSLTSNGRYFTPSEEESQASNQQRGRPKFRKNAPILTRMDSEASSVYSTVTEEAERPAPPLITSKYRNTRQNPKDKFRSPYLITSSPIGRARKSALPRKAIMVPKTLASREDTSTGEDTDSYLPYIRRPANVVA